MFATCHINAYRHTQLSREQRADLITHSPQRPQMPCCGQQPIYIASTPPYDAWPLFEGWRIKDSEKIYCPFY